MAQRYRLFSSLAALAVGTGLALGHVPAAHAGGLPGVLVAAARTSRASQSPTARAQQLVADAQAAYDARDLPGSAATWASILEVLDESGETINERDNALLISLAVHTEAFTVAREDGEELAVAIWLLRDGVDVYDAYLAAYHETYGPEALPSEPARVAGADIKRRLSAAQAELPLPAPLPPLDGEADRGTTEEDPSWPGGRTMDDYGPSGRPLIIGGALTLAGGVAASSLIIIGSQRTKAASEESQAAFLQEHKDRAAAKGRSGDAMIIGGAVLTGVLVASGATMLGLGIRRRRRYMAFSPQIHRGYVGAGLQGRF